MPAGRVVWTDDSSPRGRAHTVCSTPPLRGVASAGARMMWRFAREVAKSAASGAFRKAAPPIPCGPNTVASFRSTMGAQHQRHASSPSSFRPPSHQGIRTSTWRRGLHETTNNPSASPQPNAARELRELAAAAAGKACQHSLDRWPSWTPAGVLRGLDYIGTCVFAYTGTMKAMGAEMDLLGCVLVGLTTAVGGGTIRDLLLGATPVFWLVETEYIALAAATALSTFFLTDEPLASDSEALNWADAISLGAFACVGAMAGVRRGMPPLVTAMCGMMTATFGGVVRDLLCQEKPWILHAKSGESKLLRQATQRTVGSARGASPPNPASLSLPSRLLPSTFQCRALRDDRAGRRGGVRCGNACEASAVPAVGEQWPSCGGRTLRVLEARGEAAAPALTQGGRIARGGGDGSGGRGERRASRRSLPAAQDSA